MLFDAPCDVFLDNENVLQPDILFISKERVGVIGRKNIQGDPDLVVEILSESTAYNDLMKKKRLYAKFGVREYWIVDPDGKMVEIHSLKNGAFVLDNTFSENDELVSPLFPCLRIKQGNVKVGNIRHKYKGFINIHKNTMKRPKNRGNPATLT